MTEYLNFNDLKAVIIGLITGIVGFFICVGIQRYWSNRSIKSLKRRIEENEAYKAGLDNLARSDRALITTAFQGVFGILALICIVVVLQIFFLFGPLMEPVTALAYILIWSLPTLLCMGIIRTLQDIRNHPQSLEKIEKRIMKLKNKFLRQK